MIDGWWRPEFGREPTIEDLDEASRRAVVDRVDAAKRRSDRVVNILLVIWLTGSVAALVALAIVGLPKHGWTIVLASWLVVPSYVAGIRAMLMRKVMRRAVIRQVRRDRLAEITTVLMKR